MAQQSVLLEEALYLKHALAAAFSTLITASISRPNMPVCILFSLQTFSHFALSAVTYRLPSWNFTFRWRGQTQKQTKKKAEGSLPGDRPEEKC